MICPYLGVMVGLPSKQGRSFSVSAPRRQQQQCFLIFVPPTLASGDMLAHRRVTAFNGRVLTPMHGYGPAEDATASWSPYDLSPPEAFRSMFAHRFQGLDSEQN